MKTPICNQFHLIYSFKRLISILVSISIFQLIIRDIIFPLSNGSLRIKKIKAFTRSTNENAAIYQNAWIEKLNYTIDYGDNTCKAAKNGNRKKQMFVRLLEHWKLLSKIYDMPYFIAYGSLIGALRNSDFIPWDNDMDILVDEVNYETISKIDSKRNFTPSVTDPNFHLVVQNSFISGFSNTYKETLNCLGQVTF